MTQSIDEMRGKLIKEYNDIIEEMAIIKDNLRSSGAVLEAVGDALKRGNVNMVVADEDCISTHSLSIAPKDLAQNVRRWQYLRSERHAKEACLKEAGLERVIK